MDETTNRKSMPPHSQIFDYWKNKCITSDGNVAIEGEHDRSKSINVVEDWGEPTCWCCGKQINVYGNKNYETDTTTPSKIWDYKNVAKILNRCHIVPKSLGGKNESNNLFLMCEDCHVESPDYIDPTYFLLYIYSKRKTFSYGINWTEMLNEINKTANQLGKDVATMSFERIEREKIGIHSGRMSQKSMVAAVVDTMELRNVS